MGLILALDMVHVGAKVVSHAQAKEYKMKFY
jgi:hypothetical protein